MRGRGVQTAKDYRASVTYSRRRDYMLRHRYGIGMDDYEAMLSAQDGLCAIWEPGVDPAAPFDPRHGVVLRDVA